MKYILSATLPLSLALAATVQAQTYTVTANGENTKGVEVIYSYSLRPINCLI